MKSSRANLRLLGRRFTGSGNNFHKKEDALSVKIRLKRFGTTNRLQWRIVVADAKMPRDGRFIEEIGSYDPIPKSEKFQVKKDRLEYWVSKGAQVSPALKTLLSRTKKKEKKAAK